MSAAQVDQQHQELLQQKENEYKVMLERVAREAQAEQDRAIAELLVRTEALQKRRHDLKWFRAGNARAGARQALQNDVWNFGSPKIVLLQPWGTLNAISLVLLRFFPASFS